MTKKAYNFHFVYTVHVYEYVLSYLSNINLQTRSNGIVDIHNHFVYPRLYNSHQNEGKTGFEHANDKIFNYFQVKSACLF